jgi:hypothetical protein
MKIKGTRIIEEGVAKMKHRPIWVSHLNGTIFLDFPIGAGLLLPHHRIAQPPQGDVD